MSDKNSLFYDIHPLLELGDDDPDIKYFLSFGQRSAGKSYSTCVYILEKYMESGGNDISGICRRWDDDWTSNVANTYWDALVSNNEIERITNGMWTDVYYYGHKWYLSKYDELEDKIIKDEKPFCYAFALNTWEKTKSSNYPGMRTLVIEEYISGSRYIGSELTEFSMFLNLVSTLARNRSDFKIILLGNTIAKFGNPYHIGMGIEQGVLKMKPGQIKVFSDDSKRLKIAAEYTQPPNSKGMSKPSDILFEFTENSAARMVTSGEWQIDNHYPTLPLGTRIKPKDVQFSYFILYREHILQSDIILQDNNFYTFVHRKTTELKDTDNDIIFDLEYHIEPNYRRDIIKPIDELGKKISSFFTKELVFVQDAEVGEILYSYIQSC